MRPYKKLAILICAALLASALCGCSEKPGGAPEGGAVESTGPEGETQAPGDPSPDDGDTGDMSEIDFEAAFAAFAPDTAMIVMEDYTVTWAELYFLIRERLKSELESVVSLPDFSQVQEGGFTFAETVMESAVGRALKFRAFEHGAKLIGFTPNSDQQAFLEYMINDILESVGDEDAFVELLWENNGVKDLDLFKYLMYQDYLPYFIFMEMYGEFGEKLPDEEVALLTANDEYAVAKHIMRLRDETDAAAPINALEIVLRQLRNYDGDDFGAFFNELMYEHSEDAGGLYDFPDGYLFRPGDMEPSFDEATRSLEIGEFSGIVESGDGYHIIYRLPVNYDIVPIVYYRVNETDSLRALTAIGLLDEAMLGWKGTLSPVFTSEFESIDLSAIFVEK
ncbi:MAG: peptidylprolyl isomerase [Defluviitaleaceae bacterium]|nr:peptidylprolyl isomerase [Defluviitaleaceae bacterium]